MMVARRNWLLRCSIFINIVVLLYMCSHVMIGDSNMTMGPNYNLYQQDSIKLLQQTQYPHQSQKLSETAQFINSKSNKENSIHAEPLVIEDKVKTSEIDQHQEQFRRIVEEPSVNLIDHQEQQLQIKEAENMDDSRFEVPTEQNAVANKNDAAYPEIIVGNQSFNHDEVPTDSSDDLETKLKTIVHCHDKDYEQTVGQRGDFWVLRNYIRAEHGELRCLETLTYTTHSDYTFLDNLIPLLERWNAPVSIAMHAPGTDFTPTINSIKYLRDCIPEGPLVKQFATFHIFFSSKHIPKNVPKVDKVLQTPYNCSIPPPFKNITSAQLYKTQKKLLYPVNVGRNVARDAAMTHFILASDIELYPNPGLSQKFLEMIARNDEPLRRKYPQVFPLSIFEVDRESPVPRDKTELQELLRTSKAIPFHKRVCSSCHGVPKSKEWMAANETEELGVFHIGKRVGYFVHWEPIYIGTHADPHYDERLSWEGKSDKMTQGYALCVLDYEFKILNNAFLVHKPGIKVLKKDIKRDQLASKTNQLIRKIIYPELQVMYGTRKGCAV